MKFTELTVAYNYKRDYSFGKDQTVSIGTLSGRVRCRYQGWNKHLELIRREDVIFGAAKLWRDPATRQWYLLVTVAVPCPVVRPRDIHTVEGVDVGMRYLAVSADSRGGPGFGRAGESSTGRITTPGSAGICGAKAPVEPSAGCGVWRCGRDGFALM